MTEHQIIAACRRGDRKAQKWIYERYSPKMFGVCKRYVRKQEDAEDVLVNAMFKVLTKIDSYGGKGSFEGWIRRIVVNEALMLLRKRKDFQYAASLDEVQIADTVDVVEELKAQDIIKLLEKLPVGYRTVFNLYVIEGFKHREIAEQLGISINTSKSQLILAKKRLQKLITEQNLMG